MPDPRPAPRQSSRVGPKPAQRAAAVGAILSDALAFVLLGVLVVREPWSAVLAVVLTVGFLASSLAAATTAGLRRVAAATVAAVLAALSLLVFGGWIVGGDTGRVVGPGAFVCLVGGVVLGRYALRIPPPAEGEPVVDPPPDRPDLSRRPEPGSRAATVSGTPARRSVLIVNPKSGGGKAEEFDLVELAAELGIETIRLTEDDDLETCTRKAVADGAEVLGMAGGDGSQALVLGIAAEHGLPFVCIPAGTRNHLALDLGLDRRDPRQAFRAFTEGEVRDVDLTTVNDRVFVNNVALGVYAAIVDRDGYRDAKLQTTLELLPQVIDAGGPWCDLAFDVPDHGRQTSSLLLLVSNNPYDLAGGSIQRRRLDDGTLGVIALDPDNLRELLGITLFTAAGRPDAASALWRWETDEFRVDSSQPELSAGVDGETVTLTPPLVFRIEPRGAQVLVPPGSRLGLDEQTAGSGPRYSGLLEVAFDLPTGRD